MSGIRRIRCAISPGCPLPSPPPSSPRRPCVTGTTAQEPPPGFLDPEPILRAAREAIGTDNLRCITIAGTVDYGGMVGQQRHHGYEVDWPRMGPFPNYVRTMNWDAGTLTEAFDREPGLAPASWRWGLGWLGGTPIQQETRQHFYVNGMHGWSRDGTDSEPSPPVRRMPSAGNSTCGSTPTAS